MRDGRDIKSLLCQEGTLRYTSYTAGGEWQVVKADDADILWYMIPKLLALDHGGVCEQIMAVAFISKSWGRCFSTHSMTR